MLRCQDRLRFSEHALLPHLQIDQRPLRSSGRRGDSAEYELRVVFTDDENHIGQVIARGFDRKYISILKVSWNLVDVGQEKRFSS